MRRDRSEGYAVDDSWGYGPKTDFIVDGINYETVYIYHDATGDRELAGGLKRCSLHSLQQGGGAGRASYGEVGGV